jgi:FlaA1/EpsC-like NDP-sugar epimerase
VFMLDMGEPVSILHLAERMIRLSGRKPGTDIKIEITGIRPGEKLAEELIALDESERPTAHPSIRRVTPVPIGSECLEQEVERLTRSAQELNDEECRSILHRVAASSSSLWDEITA